MCLVCGFIGCGRYHAQHSRRHYLETLHAYAIEVQTQQVRALRSCFLVLKVGGSGWFVFWGWAGRTWMVIINTPTDTFSPSLHRQVWDYVGDGYVHRLLYHKGDGHVRTLHLNTNVHSDMPCSFSTGADPPSLPSHNTKPRCYQPHNHQRNCTPLTT